MSTRHHQLSQEMFASLASGGGEPAAIQELIATEYSAHMLLLAGVVSAARDGEQSRLARKGFDLLVAAWQVNPAAVEKVVRHPSVSVWARRVIQGCRAGPAAPGATPAGLGAVAAVAAIRAGLAAEIALPVSGGRVMLPALGAAQATGDTVRIRTTDTGRAEIDAVEVPDDPSLDAPGWRGLRRIRAGRLDVLVDDLDPFRMPDLPDLASGVDAGSWGRALRDAWGVLESHHPALATEVAALISVIVPRLSPPSGAVSTSSPQAFGAVGMSLPPDAVTGAETFAHELQHLKLGAVQKIVTLTMDDDGTRYYAPWRDDPRPLNGLLQGTYAYLGVTGFWRRQRRLPGGHRQAEAEYARWRAATTRSTETLRSSGRLTSAGEDFVRGMASTLAAWEYDRVPAGAQAQARRAAEAHMTQWQSAHGPFPSR
jgi:HEXXH motif-containing protein